VCVYIAGRRRGNKILIDYKNRQEIVFSTRKLFDMDCFTYNFVNKQDILEKMESKYNRKFKNVMIKSSFQNKEKYIYNIMYKYNSFPDEEFLINKYATFLFNNKDKIKDSFIFELPYFKNRNTDYIGYFALMEIISKYITSYRIKRKCYFHLLNSGQLKTKNIEEDDYLKSIISNIDTDDLTDDDIMIEKIRNGEIEPNFYDIEDYLSMKRYKKR